MENNEKYEYSRKLREYEMKIIKMAGHISDYYIDRAIESDDFSDISSYLIDYFSGIVGKQFDIGYLVSKYKEYELDEKIEDIDFDINEWYKIKYKYEVDSKQNPEDETTNMSDEEYIEYMIKKRRRI